MPFQIGDLATFTYRGKRVNDPNPRILVLHPNWSGLTHGLNFNYLTSQEQNYIKAVINPVFEADIVKRDQRIAIQMQRIQTTLNNLKMTSPQEFYYRFVRGFIQPRGWDPYRLYTPDDMYNTRVLTPARIMLGEGQPNAFGKMKQQLQHWRGPQAPALTLPNRHAWPEIGASQEPRSDRSPVPTLGKGGAKKLSDL